MSPHAVFGFKFSALIVVVAALIASIGCSYLASLADARDELNEYNKFTAAFGNPQVRARLIQLYLEQEADLVNAGSGSAIGDGGESGPVGGTGSGDSSTRPTDELVVDIKAAGLLATVPGYAEVDVSTARQLAVAAGLDVGGGDVLQVRVLVTRNDRWFLVITRNNPQTVFITTGLVRGALLPLPDELPDALGWLGGVIVADEVVIETPQLVTPAEVIVDPARYALRRVSMDTTYLFGGARIKDAPEGLDKIGFGQATDKLGSSEQDDYLVVVDPYNTESQIRVAQVTGTVLYATEGVRKLLEELYRFGPDDLREALDRPTVFYETLTDDEAQLVSISSLVPTPSDPRNKLGDFHGEVVSVEGIALGTMVRTEDVPKLEDMPVHVTLKGFVIADATGAMPVFAISSQDDNGEIFGHFRVELSVYRFDDGRSFAFLVGMESVPLDLVEVITDAEFGDPISLNLGSYTSVHLDSVTLSEDLTITHADLLVPDDASEPVILTQLDSIATGTRLNDVEVSGNFIGRHYLLAPVLDAIGRQSALGLVVAGGEYVRFGRVDWPEPSSCCLRN